MEDVIAPLGEAVLLEENANIPIPLLDLNSILGGEQVIDDNEEGSLTPTTKTRKIQLNNLEINAEDIEKYSKTIQTARTNTIKFFKEMLTHYGEKIDAYRRVVEQEKNDKSKLYELCNTSLQNLEKELELREEALNRIMDSGYMFEQNINNQFAFTTIYQQNIHLAHQITEDLPIVLHYGLNTNSKFLQNLVGNYIQNGILHPCEKALFIKAFEYLNQIESTENYIQTSIQDRTEYPRNVVLVDIFDRSTNVINKGHNQTHTISLWKNKDNEIVLIDPSMKSYSDHLLPDLNMLGSGFEIKVFAVDQIYGVSIYPNNNRITGYSDYQDPNPKPRDCIDIAVKIAFELNEQQRISDNFEQIRNNTKEQISNVKRNALHLGRFGDIVIRELQSSDFRIRIDAKNNLKEINDKFLNIGLQRQEELKVQNYQDICILRHIITLQEQITELKKQVVQQKNK